MGGSTAGKHVNERSAMQMTAVYSCVRILSEAVAGLLGTMAPAVLSQASAIAKEQGIDTAGLVNLIGEKANSMPDAQLADYILDDGPGISDDIKRGFKKLFG